MDILSIVLALWRHKLAVAFVVVLTLVGCVYVLAVQPSQYESSATLLLVPPPPPPSEAQRLADPSLASANTDNPFTRQYDAGIVINVVSGVVSSDRVRSELADAGADPRFTVAQTARYGFGSPVAEINVTAATPSDAQSTATMVVNTFRSELERLQADEKVDTRYFIGTRLVGAPEPGVLRASGKLRALLGVVGLGVLGLFTVVSTADAIGRARSGRGSERSRRIEHEPEEGLPERRLLPTPSEPAKLPERPLAPTVLPAERLRALPPPPHPYLLQGRASLESDGAPLRGPTGPQGRTASPWSEDGASVSLPFPKPGVAKRVDDSATPHDSDEGSEESRDPRVS